LIRELKTNYGTMYVPTTDHGQYDWLSKTGQSPEDREIVTVLEILKEQPRGMFIDCGASFGCWSLAVRPHVHRVLAFEPQRQIFELLLKSIHYNDPLNIKALNVAVGDELGYAEVAQLDLETKANFGGLSLNEQLVDYQPNQPMETVKVTRVDDHIYSNEHVSLMKIDVEGFEQKVLRGAAKTIERCRPIMYIEVVHKFTDTKALVNQIADFGYVVEMRDGNALCLPVVK
jgi:FkbM family methyltransferase